MPEPHPIAGMLSAAAELRFPPMDGGVDRVAPWRPGVGAVVAFTGHAVLAVDPTVTKDLLSTLHLDGFGGATHPRVVTALAGPDGWIDSLDAVLVARGTGLGSDDVVPRPDLAEHERVRHARLIRNDVRVWGPARGTPADGALITIARGLGGLTELSIEIPAAAHGRGVGRALTAAALDLCARDEVVVAAVAPGNAASLRAALAVGFQPVASVQLYCPARPNTIRT